MHGKGARAIFGYPRTTCGASRPARRPGCPAASPDLLLEQHDVTVGAALGVQQQDGQLQPALVPVGHQALGQLGHGQRLGPAAQVDPRVRGQGEGAGHGVAVDLPAVRAEFPVRLGGAVRRGPAVVLALVQVQGAVQHQTQAAVRPSGEVDQVAGVDRAAELLPIGDRQRAGAVRQAGEHHVGRPAGGGGRQPCRQPGGQVRDRLGVRQRPGHGRAEADGGHRPAPQHGDPALRDRAQVRGVDHAEGDRGRVPEGQAAGAGDLRLAQPLAGDGVAEPAHRGLPVGVTEDVLHGGLGPAGPDARGEPADRPDVGGQARLQRVVGRQVRHPPAVHPPGHRQFVRDQQGAGPCGRDRVALERQREPARGADRQDGRGHRRGRGERHPDPAAPGPDPPQPGGGGRVTGRRGPGQGVQGQPQAQVVPGVRGQQVDPISHGPIPPRSASAPDPWPGRPGRGTAAP